MLYDELGGLRHVTLPSGTHHSFSSQPSIGFIRYTYTPPGSTRAYLQHYTHAGQLLQTVYPGDGARVLYRYHNSEQLAEVNFYIHNSCEHEKLLAHVCCLLDTTLASKFLCCYFCINLFKQLNKHKKCCSLLFFNLSKRQSISFTILL